jgi:endonuclease/exonuclease/phosphatase family metal-dependent hydrolase
VRVLTWNLWWRFGDWAAREAAIRAVLSETRPDVCGLQEVWATAGDNQAARLAEALGFAWVWHPSPAGEHWQRRVGETGVQVGNAVLSRWPVLDHRAEVLPGEERDPGRLLVHATLDAPGGTVPLFTTQWSSAPDGSAVRVRQAVAVARAVADAAGGHGHPPVVTGDLNAEPDADEVRLLCGHKTAPAVPGQVLVDAWRYADPGDPGWTWDRANPHVRATYEPSARIDYVLVGPPAQDGRGHVQRAGLAGTAPVGGVWASDHAALVVDLAPGADRR